MKPEIVPPQLSSLTPSFARTLTAIRSELGRVIRPVVKDAPALDALKRVDELLAGLLAEPGTGAAHANAQETLADGAAGNANAREATADGAVDSAALTQYLRGRTGTVADVSVEKITSILGGAMKHTFIVELAGADRPADWIVIRRDRQGVIAGGSGNSSVTHEMALLPEAYAQGVPVAEPLWVETDPKVLGSPFLVSRRIAGSSVMDMHGRITSTNPAQAAKLLAKALAKIHAFDWSPLSLPPEVAQRSVQQHVLNLIDVWEDQWRQRRIRTSPTIAAALAWMHNNVPARAVKAVVVHGDASLRNLMSHADQLTGMLDWEFWHIGDAAEDLAYCRMDVEQVMPWNEFLDEYRRQGGVDVSEESIRFYSFWQALRIAIGCMAFGCEIAEDPAPSQVLPAFIVSHHYPWLIQAVGAQLGKLI